MVPNRLLLATREAESRKAEAQQRERGGLRNHERTANLATAILRCVEVDVRQSRQDLVLQRDQVEARSVALGGVPYG